MAQFTTYNTPDIIKNLPEFNGDFRQLDNFITCVNPVALLIETCTETTKPFLFRAIRNKITGIASERLRLYGEPDNWNAIREVLKLHFSDHRDTRTLYSSLNALKQTTSVNAFYDKVLELVTALNSKARRDTTDARLIQPTVDRNLAEGLQIFINGVNEPLKTILLSRNPTSLDTAYTIAMQLQYDKSTFTKQTSIGSAGHSGQTSRQYNQANQNNTNPAIRQYNQANQNNTIPAIRQYNQANTTQANRNPFNQKPTNRAEPMDVDQSTGNTRRTNPFSNYAQQNTQARGFSNQNTIEVEEIFVGEDFQEEEPPIGNP